MCEPSFETALRVVLCAVSAQNEMNFGFTSLRTADTTALFLASSKLQKVRTDPAFAQCHVDRNRDIFALFFRLSSFRFSLSQLLAGSQRF
jgi:hypothetical protein